MFMSFIRQNICKEESPSKCFGNISRSWTSSYYGGTWSFRTYHGEQLVDEIRLLEFTYLIV